MGRLQKKKSVVEKTKQRLKIREKADYSNNDTESTDNNGAAIKKPLFGASGLKDTKIKLVQPTKKDPVITKLSELSQKNSFIAKSIDFFKEVKIELNKVTWPTKQQTTASTIVVVVLVIIMSIFLGLVDLSLSKIIEMLLQ
jgi:preprotein translocase subunit SecE